MNVVFLALAGGGLIAAMVCMAWGVHLQDNIWLRHRTRAKGLFVAAFCFLILSLGLAVVCLIDLK